LEESKFELHGVNGFQKTLQLKEELHNKQMMNFSSTKIVSHHKNTPMINRLLSTLSCSTLLMTAKDKLSVTKFESA
jgi:hypothetical protein